MDQLGFVSSLCNHAIETRLVQLDRRQEWRATIQLLQRDWIVVIRYVETRCRSRASRMGTSTTSKGAFGFAQGIKWMWMRGAVSHTRNHPDITRPSNGIIPYTRPSRYHRGLPAISYHTLQPILSIHQLQLSREQVYPLWKHNDIYNYHRMSRLTLSCSHIQYDNYLVYDCLVCQFNVPRYSPACVCLPRYVLTP